MSPRQKILSAFAGIVVIGLAIATPALIAWNLERTQQEAFRREASLLDVAISDRIKRAKAAQDISGPDLVRWVFRERMALADKFVASPAPKFAKSMQALSTVMHQIEEQFDSIERAATIIASVRALKPEDVKREPARAEQALADIKELKAIADARQVDATTGREAARNAIAASGMDKDTRAVTWQFADAAYIELARGAKDMASAKGVMDATAEVISFLFENRESYNVRDDGVLEFHDQAKLSHYRTLQFILESETRRVSRG